MAIGTLCVALHVLCAPAAAQPPADALQNRVGAELRSFTDWLEANGARGYVGEVGWPDGSSGAAQKWNDLGEFWFDRADAAGLWVSGWATGEWWGPDYDLSVYENRLGDSESGVESANSQARVFEAHPGAAPWTRGITVNGGEFGSPIAAKRSQFSNENLGRYQTRYHYDRQHTFDYLAGRGVGHVRIPFRWERLQPQLGEALDADEVHRLKSVIGRARAAGLGVILDMHNYGAYYVSNGDEGIRRPIGSRQVSIADFVDAWRLISVEFSAVDGIIGYVLMAEPFDLSSVGRLSPVEVWEAASQRALNAIRATDDRRVVSVSGYAWSSLSRWTKIHPRGWIEDPASNFLYEAHHYWDRDYSGDYVHSYDAEVEWSRRQRSSVGSS